MRKKVGLSSKEDEMSRWILVVAALMLACVAGCGQDGYRGLPASEDDASTKTDTTPDTAPTCPMRQSLCGGACVSTDADNANCGACGQACTGVSSCVGGACRCPTNLAQCGDVCVDTLSDNANCAACGRACPSGQNCVSAACVSGCPLPNRMCGAVCTSTATDANNCGACGRMCPLSQACVAGACSCQGDRTACGDACVNTDSDRFHCGGCGNMCPSGACIGGACSQLAPDAGTPDVLPADPCTRYTTCGACAPVNPCGWCSATGRCVSGTASGPLTGTCGGYVWNVAACGGDAATPPTDVPTSCSAVNLGSSIGAGAVRGTTAGRASQHTPSCVTTSTAPDVAYAWTAPTAGTYTFDTVGSSYDTVLSLRSGSCDGPSIACNDDISTTVRDSRVTATLAVGQSVLVVVDGYDGSASGAFVLNISRGGTTDGGTPPVDPCGGVTVRGRCATTARAEYCVSTSEVGDQRIVRIDCVGGERCSTDADGNAGCQLVAACRDGATECIGLTQLRTCVGGSWVTRTCPRECISTPIGDSCGADLATRMVSGRVVYEARGLDRLPDPRDWGTTPIAARAQGFMVLSVRRNADMSQTLIDATTTSVGTDGGRFSIRVPTSATVNDSIVVVTASADALGNLNYIVAIPGFSFVDAPRQLAGVQPPNATLWAWPRQSDRFVSGDTITITTAEGSGAARVFDYLRYVYGYAQEKFGRPGMTLVAWVQYGTRWNCGACMASSPILLFGNATTPGINFDAQVWIDGGSLSQGYWSDAVTSHEFGHWVMNSFSARPTESGRHLLGSRVYPGMAWSEGFATWFSSDARGDTLYFDKQTNETGTGTNFLWFDIGSRRYGTPPSTPPAWTRPTASAGLVQRIDENEVAAMLWAIRGGSASTIAAMYQALASPHMRGSPFARGYTAWDWELDERTGEIVGAYDTGSPAPHLADFLDALMCSGFNRSAIDAATQPTLYYPYPSAAPLCP